VAGIWSIQRYCEMTCPAWKWRLSRFLARWVAGPRLVAFGLAANLMGGQGSLTLADRWTIARLLARGPGGTAA
jgi:hypothetical protein